MENNNLIKYYIENVDYVDGTCTVSGWCLSLAGKTKYKINVYNKDGEKIKINSSFCERNDVSHEYNIIDFEQSGFTIGFAGKKNEKYIITFEFEDDSDSYVITFWNVFILNLKKALYQKFSKLANIFAKKEMVNYITVTNNNDQYPSYKLKTNVSALEIYKQKARHFPKNSPKFSIVIPLFNTKLDFLWPLLCSFLNQTYNNFEVCFADASSKDDLKEEIQILTNNDPRFIYKKLKKNLGISDNTNEAIKLATGDFVVFCDHDDMLEINALYEYADAILKNPNIDCLYGDEDKINTIDGTYFDGFFKPDFSIDYLTNNNYICHPFCVRREFIEKYGDLNSEYDGAQDHDFVLRMVEKARVVYHVPKILYHWRSHPESTSVNPEAKLYAFDAGKKAVLAHYERIWPQFPIDKIDTGYARGIYHIKFRFDKQPLISVIIPNKDHVDDLEVSIESIISKSTWKNIEFIIVENNSEEKKTWDFYKKIQNKYSNVKVINYDGDFNYSKINNFAVKFAKGDYLLFLNNDTEMIFDNSIEEMMGYAQRPDVGAVGARLLYNDGTIQHAGVVIGVLGVGDHAFRGFNSEETYFKKALTVHNVSAVTAAVMLVRRDVFEDINGFDEQFKVAFNDVDLCMRIREKNKLIVYNSYALFNHYESKSRGLEDTPEKLERFHSEISLFVKRYKSFLEKGDPYYNPNFTLKKADYSLKDLTTEKIGKPFYSKEDMNYWLNWKK